MNLFFETINVHVMTLIYLMKAEVIKFIQFIFVDIFNVTNIYIQNLIKKLTKNKLIENIIL